MRVLKSLLLIAALLATIGARAEDTARPISGYSHQRWGEESTAPAPIFAIAQGKDSFLWLATGEGLFRFDGLGFEPIRPEGHVRQDTAGALLVQRSGTVWTYFDGSRRFAVYQDHRLRLVDVPFAPEHVVAFAEGADDSVWALTSNHHAEVLRFRRGRWTAYSTGQGLPRDDSLSMLVAADGALWVSLCNSIVRLPRGAERFEVVRVTPRANGTLSQDPAGRIWLSERRGSYPLTGAAGQGRVAMLRYPYRTDDAQIRGAPMFDRAGNLWIAMRYGGVQRVASPDPGGPRSLAASTVKVETVRGVDGLSSEVTRQAFEDREGNIWIGSEKGLDKFRPASLRSEPMLNAPAAFGDKLMEASDGSIYIGQSRTIYRVRPNGQPEAILRGIREPQSLCEAPDRAIWIGFATHITVWHDGRELRTFARPVTHSIIYDCAFDRKGDYWISAAAGGLQRYRRGRWQQIFGPARDGFLPMTMVSNARGQLVVQWADRRLAWIDRDVLRTVRTLDFDGHSPDVVSLYATRDNQLLAAGAFGLARYRDGRIERILQDPASRNSRINGIVRTPEGDTWLTFPRALVRIGPRALERAFVAHAFPERLMSFGFGDGLTSRPHSHSQRAIVRGGDGRLWIATETGTLWMDPTRIRRNLLAPALAIKSLTGDARLFRDPASVHLRAATANIEIDYAALSFSDPKNVQVRYRLEGYDEAWVDPGTRRQAFYTGLPPGSYRFHVIAANSEGVWNRAGATVSFEIPPTFFQSRLFVALCVAVGCALLWLTYRVRVAQLAGRIRARLEERAGERERIARELHDTLLQSVQGLILRFQSVADRLLPTEPARLQLEAALARADDIVIEGRTRVRDLRSTGTSGDAREILAELVARTDFDPAVSLRIIVEGRPRTLHPLVSAEISRIAREALFNVARHARATNVEIAITFDRRQLGIRIRDDGMGLPESVLVRGHREGHFGLIGMRERAERIGGALLIDSAPGRGTDVMLVLPSKLAFDVTWSNSPRRSRISRLMQRKVIHA